MKFFIPFFLFFIFLLNISFCEFVEAFGGNITPVNLSILQTTPWWQIFYGNASNIQLTNFTSSNQSSSFISLSSNTTDYYLISDSPIIEGNFSIPTFEELDEHFGLFGHSSFQYIFDNTSKFFLNSGKNIEEFVLPTLFLAGLTENGSINNFSFREGIIKKGNSYVFVVPINRSKALDGNYYDYIFALPTKLEGITYYVFLNVISKDKEIDSAGSIIDFVPLSWSYDGQKLTIFTKPNSQIIVFDELGSLVQGTSNNDGFYVLDVIPGSKYYIKVKKEGYRDSELVLYIPLPQIIQNISEEQKEAPVIKPEQVLEEELKIEGEQKVYIQTSGGSVISICFDKECYSTTFASTQEIEKLSELSCIGQFCKLVGISKTEFINKYNLKFVESKIPTQQNQSNFLLDYNKFFESLGYELSRSLGTTKIFLNKDPYFFVYLSVFISTLALVIYVALNKIFSFVPKRGHD